VPFEVGEIHILICVTPRRTEAADGPSDANCRQSCCPPRPPITAPTTGSASVIVLAAPRVGSALLKKACRRSQVQLDASKFLRLLFPSDAPSSKLDASKPTESDGHPPIGGRNLQKQLWGSLMTETDSVATYRRIAEVLRSAQRVAIEVENAPDKRKRLRTFSFPEVATLLGLKLRDVNAHFRSAEEREAPSRNRLSLEEMLSLRLSLNAEASDLSVLPWRRPHLNEGLATVVFTNFKGGSAKTTSSVHFAQYLARAGYRVLLIDLDSQASATAQFGIDPSTEVGLENSFAAWTNAREEGRELAAASICQRTYWTSIDLVPAGAILAQAEESLVRRSANGKVEDVLYFDEFASFLSHLGDSYDIAVVDTRPDVNMLMTVALHAATGLIVPTRATMTDLASTGEFFAHLASYVADFREAFGSSLETRFTKVMVTAYDPTDRSQEALVSLIRERFGDAVLPGAFLHSRIMGTAGFGKETLYEYEPSTDRAAYNRVLASANGVNQAIEQEIHRAWKRGLNPDHTRSQEARA
jgi:chromosome partitioning protein